MVFSMGMMGQGMGMQDPEVPDRIKQVHVKWWWTLIICFLTTCILQWIAYDIANGIIGVIIALVAWWMIKDDCARMNQCCLLWIGVFSLVQVIFDVILLAQSAGGRSEDHSERHVMHQGDQEVTTVTMTERNRSFFDSGEGWHYNLQSAVMILGVVIYIPGVVLSYLSYNAYPRGLFSPPEDDGGQEQQGFFGGRTPGYGGPGAGGGGGGTGPTGNIRGPGGGSGFQPFSAGGGQRLGGSGGGPVGRGPQGPQGPVPFQGGGQRLGSS